MSTNCIATCEIANIHCNKEGKRFFAPYSVDCGRIIIAFILNMANNDTPVGALPATPNIQYPNSKYRLSTMKSRFRLKFRFVGE